MITCGIDIGTNTVRIAVAEVEPQTYTIKQFYVNMRRITRLGAHLYETGKLSAKGVDDTLKMLDDFRREMSDYNIHRTLAVATSAVREADNAQELIKAAADLGFDVKVITGIEEAKYTYYGVKCKYPDAENIMFYDIGGGSTEISYAKDGEITFSESLAMGVVKLSDRFNMAGPVSMRELEECSRYISAELSGGLRNVELNDFILVGTAGSVTTIASVMLGLVDYGAEVLNTFIIRADALDALIERFMPLNKQERCAIPGVSDGRDDLIIPGALVIKKILSMTGCPHTHVSTFGLREGLLIAAGLY